MNERCVKIVRHAGYQGNSPHEFEVSTRFLSLVQKYVCNTVFLQFQIFFRHNKQHISASPNILFLVSFLSSVPLLGYSKDMIRWTCVSCLVWCMEGEKKSVWLSSDVKYIWDLKFCTWPECSLHCLVLLSVPHFNTIHPLSPLLLSDHFTQSFMEAVFLLFFYKSYFQ